MRITLNADSTQLGILMGAIEGQFQTLGNRGAEWLDREIDNAATGGDEKLSDGAFCFNILKIAPIYRALLRAWAAEGSLCGEGCFVAANSAEFAAAVTAARGPGPESSGGDMRDTDRGPAMKISLELHSEALVNFREAMAVLEFGDDVNLRRALAFHLVRLGADAVARAGFLRMPIGCSMELHPWTADEWAVHRRLEAAQAAPAKPSAD